MENRGFRNTDRQKIVLSLAAVFAIHFAITIVYVIPNHYFPQSVNRIAGAYMMPVFHQAWDLFAPDPPLQEKCLEFRMLHGEVWTGWLNPGEALLVDHDRCRLSNANIAFRLHQNAAYRVWEASYRADEVAARRGEDFDRLDHLRGSRGFQTAHHYAVQWYRKNTDLPPPDSLQMRLIIRTPPPFQGESRAWSESTITLPKDAVR